MTRLKDKFALITGATSGIGLETARQFLAEGASVAITGRSESGLEKAGRELNGSALLIRSDAGDVAGQRMLAREITRYWPRLDVLFINAGDVTHRPLQDWDGAAYDRIMDVNLKRAFLSDSGAAAPALQSVIGDPVWFGERPYRLAAKQRLCGKQSRATVTGPDLVRGTEGSRHPCERFEPGPDGNASSGKIGLTARRRRGLA